MNFSKSLLLLIFNVNVIVGHAQQNEHKAYFAGELNLGNYVGVDMGFTYVYKTYSFKVGYGENTQESRSIPEDFSSGLANTVLLGDLSDPRDKLTNFHIGIGKVYNLNEKETVRANLSIGLGYMGVLEAGGWEKVNNGLFTKNYNYSYQKRNTISLVINPKLEIPFSSFFGFTISPMLQISTKRTFAGIGIGAMIGELKSM